MLQTEAAPNVINCCPDPHEGAPSAVPATQNKPEVLKLPSYMELEDVKTTLSIRFKVTDDYLRHPYFVRPARHVKHFWSSATLKNNTFTATAPNVINHCPTSADPHEGAPSAVPATQNEPEVFKLPSYMELEDVKTTLSCEASLKK